MPASVEDAKKVDLLARPVIATRAKLDDDAVRKEIIDALRMLKGATTKLQSLMTR